MSTKKRDHKRTEDFIAFLIVTVAVTVIGFILIEILTLGEESTLPSRILEGVILLLTGAAVGGYAVYGEAFIKYLVESDSKRENSPSELKVESSKPNADCASGLHRWKFVRIGLVPQYTDEQLNAMSEADEMINCMKGKKAELYKCSVCRATKTVDVK